MVDGFVSISILMIIIIILIKHCLIDMTVVLGLERSQLMDQPQSVVHHHYHLQAYNSQHRGLLAV